MSKAIYANLLVALDGSARSRAVFDAALEVAERFDSRVHLFRAVVVPPEFPAAGHMPPDRLPAFLEREAREFLERFAAGRPWIEIEPLDMTNAQPWRAIIQMATKIEADLIIIGSHGHSGWDRILGTNASKVADHADRSVLVVHERHPE